MKLPLSFIALLLGAPLALAEDAQTEKKPAPTNPAPKPTLWLPAGMARADKPQEVAALHNEWNRERVKAIRKEPKPELTAQEEYQLKLIAYRTQLVEEQRQRRIQELELELEREARIRAEERAALAERERRRESIYLQHHSVHAYQRNLNDEFWREQRLRKIIEQECSQPTPCPPAPCPGPTPAPASGEESSGEALP